MTCGKVNSVLNMSVLTGKKSIDLGQSPLQPKLVAQPPKKPEPHGAPFPRIGGHLLNSLQRCVVDHLHLQVGLQTH